MNNIQAQIDKTEQEFQNQYSSFIDKALKLLNVNIVSGISTKVSVVVFVITAIVFLAFYNYHGWVSIAGMIVTVVVGYKIMSSQKQDIKYRVYNVEEYINSKKPIIEDKKSL